MLLSSPSPLVISDRPGFTSPSPTSRSYPHSSRLQSSDPTAHALPTVVTIPSISKTQASTDRRSPTISSNLTSVTHSRQSRHRRRSSSVTVVNVDNSTSTCSISLSSAPAQSIPPTCPELIQSSSFSNVTIQSSHSIHKLCHQPCQPNAEEAFTPSSVDRRTNTLLTTHSSRSSIAINKSHGGSSYTDNAPQRRHSDRITGPRSRLSQPQPPSDRGASSRQSSGLTSDLTAHRHHTYTTTPLTPSPASDCTVKHVRRPSNASISSSSSISGPASISSDFGATLNIGPQSNVHLSGSHFSSSSLPNNSTLSSSIDHRDSKSLPTVRSWSRDEEGNCRARRAAHPHVTDDHRSYDYNSQWDPNDSSPGNNSTIDHLPFDSPSNMSLSPDLTSSSRLGGPMMNGVVPPLAPQTHRYQCMEPGCGKTFSRPSSLKIHSYSHTGQKPFKCMRCDRAFSVQSNLKRHQKVHEKRNVAGPGRILSGSGGNATMTMMFERGSGRLIEEESGEEDHGSDQGMDDRMEE